MKLYKLFNKKVFHIEPDLERVKKALKELSNPHNDYPSILISGTNGKGSTAAFLESILRRHNLKTGLFTSPHVIEENERWRINRENINDEELEEYIKLIKPLIKKYNLTYFEASAVLAFKYFSDKKVDIAVLEVGLGGRWDATNVVYPEVSIITNVSLDHTHILGDTTYKIASEKIGIARKDRPLVIGEEQMELITQAVLKGVREIYHYPIGFTYHVEKDKMRYTFKDLKIYDLKPSLLGKRQFSNTATAITGFLLYSERKGIKVETEKIKKAVSSTFLPARMQILSDNPPVILDGAHNEDAIIKTLEEIKLLYPEKKIISIYGGMKDKDWKKIFRIIEYNSKKVITTTIPVSRALSSSDFPEGVTFFDNVKDAFYHAKKISSNEDIILITGSLYLAGEFLKIDS
ncbi:dihydrofolate synthase / folylpolyglutamate synthase [Persephonella hydrogeniphila]|uniref:Dihydrofolate synthase/folylpolyglutamate synthase n=1 Tax=Persephonella hydrogeniphila TaxID=198703 RepID=A0A285N061_9AQUI|nr:folylpolyglutamate synthase/dihydrofolate synthase family protein [Persephonella hydrogeniphila]SNZ02313.1 dihydrofolate synthase / folylpolyglutamate synthase [Persephonella hydrogeniphila]